MALGAAAILTLIVLGLGRSLLIAGYGFDIAQGAHWRLFARALDGWWSDGRAMKGGFLAGLSAIAAAEAVALWLVLWAAVRRPGLLTLATKPLASMLRGARWLLALPLRLLAKAWLSMPKPTVSFRAEIAFESKRRLPAATVATAAPAGDDPALQSRPRLVIGADGERRREAPPPSAAPPVPDAGGRPESGLSYDDEELAPSPATPRTAAMGLSDLRGKLGVWLTDRGWNIRHEIQVHADVGGFAQDRYDADPGAEVPLLAIAAEEIRVIVYASLGDATWLAAHWDPDANGIPEWRTDDGSTMPCPVSRAARTMLRFLDHHRENLQQTGQMASSQVFATVVLAGGDVQDFVDHQTAWEAAGIDVVHLDQDGALERVFGESAPGGGESSSSLLLSRVIETQSRELRRRVTPR